MVTLKIDCSHCGRELHDEISADDPTTFTPEGLAKITAILERKKWIVQINGDNVDTYCSKTCAK